MATARIAAGASVRTTEGAGALAEGRPFALPLVSVIVTAHNYGRFLEATIASVLGQSYRDVECIVVDDGSRDETAEVLEAAEAAGAGRVIVVRNPRPLGQGVASRVGFEASRGQYVVFMDGDDILEPDFVRDHIYVNLSSRTPVGCTSSDIYQAVDGRIVLATGESLSRSLMQPTPERPNAFRPLAAAPEGPWPYGGPGAALLDAVRYVPPGGTFWVWSPMTANMFRRDALTFFIGCDGFDGMRLSTDVYLCTGVSVLCGSLLIDKPLSYYRIHGANCGTYQAQLTNVRSVRAESELSRRARELLIEDMTANAPNICARLWDAQPLLVALEALEADQGERGPTSHLARCVERHWPAMAASVGEARLVAWNAPRAASPSAPLHTAADATVPPSPAAPVMAAARSKATWRPRLWPTHARGGPDP